jgi:catechol 2,3-dioxygenase-like lactoylglutathione lyase family enzyme
MLANIPLQPRLPASDLDRARAWYRDKLDLEPERVDDGGLWYRTGGTWFLVFQTVNAGTARNTAAGWTVPDLGAFMTDLRGRGVSFDDVDLGNGMKTVDGLLVIDGFKLAWFRDSEGNTFEVSQLPAG